MNEAVTYKVLQDVIGRGMREVVLCAGSRNSSFVEVLRTESRITTYYWPEERSGAFFALGRARRSGKPVAVITTSGTAVGELLPAVMEAFHSGVPLLLITADRPSKFRGTGAPQSCMQPNIFGVYTPFTLDVATEADCVLVGWNGREPAHINVCLDEPQGQPKFVGRTLVIEEAVQKNKLEHQFEKENVTLEKFLSNTRRPLVIVSTLREEVREATLKFLLKLGAPVMLEAISGLREAPLLQPLRIKSTDKILETADLSGYPIDGVLRIGGIPTHRIWRDLEYKENQIAVCNITELQFSGLSWHPSTLQVDMANFLSQFSPPKAESMAEEWFTVDSSFINSTQEIINQEPFSEVALLRGLSYKIGHNAHVYLGNSLPIREWDLAATHEWKNFDIQANRGVNGIDGQLSTFLGLCKPGVENWGIFGDLTTLYDLAGPWALSQLHPMQINIVVINNGGGKLFERMYPYKEMINAHSLKFEALASFWGLNYIRFETGEEPIRGNFNLIEVVPDSEASIRFWDKMNALRLDLAALKVER